FFFSSRRRHTRCLSDWSSDVCSSDLIDIGAVDRQGSRKLDFGADTMRRALVEFAAALSIYRTYVNVDGPSPEDEAVIAAAVSGRSEESRVGRECGSGGGAQDRR